MDSFSFSLLHFLAFLGAISLLTPFSFSPPSLVEALSPLQFYIYQKYKCLRVEYSKAKMFYPTTSKTNKTGALFG